VRKLAAEMTALALTDAGLREVAGTCRTGLIIASSVPELGEQVREEFGFPARGLVSRSAHVSSLHAVVAAAGALQTGQLDLAVAGGAELGLDPVWLALQDRAGALGAGEIRVYTADPAGQQPGEGCGMVVLVRGRCPGGGSAGLRGDRGLEYAAHWFRTAWPGAAPGVPAGRV
jgi:hypothetical protein